MLVSFQHNFIHIKNREVAGSPMEFHLSRFSGSDDIVSRSECEADFLPSQMQQTFGRTQRFQNMGDLADHATASQIKGQVGDEVWQGSFKFCFERDPIAKTVAHYRYQMSGLTGCADPVAAYLDMFGPYFASDFPAYMENGQPLVDFVGNYDEMDEHFGQICAYLNLPFDQPLDIQARAEYYRADLPDFPDTDTHRQMIADAYALEAAYLPWMTVDGFTPSSPAVLSCGQARATLQNGDTRGAAAYAIQALNEDRKHAPSWIIAANIHAAAGENDVALAAATNAVQLDPTIGGAALLLAQLQWRVKKRKAAERTLLEALQRTPGNLHLFDELANLYRRLGQTDTAIKVMVETQKLFDPASYKLVLRQSEALRLAGQLQAARDLVTERLSADADIGEVTVLPRHALTIHRAKTELTEIAFALLAAGDFEQSADILMNEALIAADSGSGLGTLVEALSKAEHHQAARAVIEWGLPTNPTGPRFYRQSVQALKRDPNSDKALMKRVRNVVKTFPRNRTNQTDPAGVS